MPYKINQQKKTKKWPIDYNLQITKQIKYSCKGGCMSGWLDGLFWKGGYVNRRVM